MADFRAIAHALQSLFARECGKDTSGSETPGLARTRKKTPSGVMQRRETRNGAMRGREVSGQRFAIVAHRTSFRNWDIRPSMAEHMNGTVSDELNIHLGGTPLSCFRVDRPQERTT